MSKVDGRAKTQRVAFPVIPAKAGILENQALLDPGFRRGDGLESLCEAVEFRAFVIGRSVSDVKSIDARGTF